MNDHQLLRALKAENLSLKQQYGELLNESHRVWKLIQELNQLQVNRRVLNNTEDILAMVREILRIALEAVDSENGSLLLYDRDDHELVFIAVVGARSDELLDYRIPADQGIAGWVGMKGKSALVSDVRRDSRWLPSVDQSVGFHSQSLMAVPLIIEDRLLGVMEVVNSRSENHFGEKDLQLLRLVARLASFVLGFTEEVLRNTSPSSFQQV